jgi:type IV pilus assembly protein PilM
MSQSTFMNQARALRARILKPSWAPMNPRGPVTALDWDGHNLWVAQSAPRGGEGGIARCDTARLERPVRGEDAEAEAGGAAIAQALRRLKIKPGLVVIGIPRGRVFLRNLSLPKTDTSEEFAAMVHFQINKDLPFPIEDAVIDFQLNAIPAPANSTSTTSEKEAGEDQKSGKQDVLVAVVKKEVVRHYERLASAAGFKLAALSLGSSANARGLQACEPPGGQGTAALVSLRQEEVVIDIVVGGSLAFSRTASLSRPGSTELPAAEPTPEKPPVTDPSPPVAEAGTPLESTGWIDTAVIDVVRALHHYEGMEQPAPVEKIWVAGPTGGIEELAEALTRRLNHTCQRLEPGAFARLAGKENRTGAEALTAVGLALGAQDPAGLPFDFLNPKRLPTQRNWRRIKLAAAAVAALILLTAVGSVRAHLIKQRARIRDQIQAQADLAAKNRALYRDLRGKAKMVNGWMADKKQWLDHYAFLSALLPPCTDVYITSFSTGARGVLHLSIQARSSEILAQIDKRLREAGYDLKPLAVSPGSDKLGYTFQSSLELVLPEKTKLDLSTLKVPARPDDDASLDPPRTRLKRESAPPPAPSAEDGETRKPGRRRRG